MSARHGPPESSRELGTLEESNKRKLFLTIIEPSFTDLQPVIQSYGDDMAVLRDDIFKATDNTAAYSALRDYIEKRRKLVRERTRLISVLNETLSYWNKRSKRQMRSEAVIYFETFLEDLRHYFNLSESRFNGSRDESLRATDDVDMGWTVSTGLIKAIHQALKDRGVPPGTIGVLLPPSAPRKRGKANALRTPLQQPSMTPSLPAVMGGPADLNVDNFPDVRSIIEQAIDGLERRSGSLYRSFAALKLECTEG